MTFFPDSGRAFARGSLCLLLACLGAVGCARTHKGEYPALEPGSVHDKLFPWYAAIWAVTQIRARFADQGGAPGFRPRQQFRPIVMRAETQRRRGSANLRGHLRARSGELGLRR